MKDLTREDLDRIYGEKTRYLDEAFGCNKAMEKYIALGLTEVEAFIFSRFCRSLHEISRRTRYRFNISAEEFVLSWKSGSEKLQANNIDKPIADFNPRVYKGDVVFALEKNYDKGYFPEPRT